jgi:hypothetical protein
MMKKNKGKRIEKATPRENALIRIASKGSASAAAGAVVGGAPGALAGAATGLFSGLVEEIGDVLTERRKHRMAALLERILEEVGGNDPEQVRSRIAALRDEPFFVDAIVEAFKKLDDSLDPAVLPSMAALVATYRGQAVDAFFRGAGRLLADLVPGELASLHMMLAAVVRQRFPHGRLSVFTDGTGELSIQKSVGDGEPEGRFVAVGSETEKLGCNLSHAERVLYLLNAHGLGVGDATNGISLDEATVRRLQAIIRLT